MLLDLIDKLASPKGKTIIGGILDAGAYAYDAYNRANAYDFNAAMMEMEARYRKRKATLDAQTLIEKTQMKIGEFRAREGSSGFAVDTGTNLVVMDRMARSGELDAAMIRLEGDIGSWAARENARLEGDAADRARAAGFINIGKSVADTIFRLDDIGSPKPAPEKEGQLKKKRKPMLYRPGEPYKL